MDTRDWRCTRIVGRLRVREGCTVEAAYNGRQRSVTEVIPTGKPGGTGSGAKATLSTQWAPKKGRSGVDVVSRNSDKEAIGAGKSQPRKSGSALFGRVLFIDVG